MRRFAFLVLLLVFLSSGSYAWFNDPGNDSCLTIYSNEQIYIIGPNEDVTAQLKIDNKCGGEIKEAQLGIFIEGKDIETKMKAIQLQSGEKTIIEQKRYECPYTLNVLGTQAQCIREDANGASILFDRAVDSTAGKTAYWTEETVQPTVAEVSLPFDKDIMAPETSKQFMLLDGRKGFPVAEGISYIQVNFLPPYDLIHRHGEFIITLNDLENKGWRSELDPSWWETGEYSTDANTIALYHCNQDAGTVVTDATGNYDATATNAAIWDIANKRWGSAACGMDQLYYFSQATLIDTIPAQYTIEAWVMPEQTFQAGMAAFHSLMGKKQLDGTHRIIAQWQKTDGKLNINWDDGTAHGLISTTDTWTSGTWYHIALVYDGTNAALFVNGVQQDTEAINTIGNGTLSDFYVGAGASGDSIANAVIDEFRVSDMNRWYNAPPAPPAVTKIDANVWAVDGYLDSGQYKAFYYAVDGNLTIDFNVFNKDNNRMFIDINYSTSPTQGTGMPIVSDLNLNAGVCADQNFADNSNCHWDWNIATVADDNYYILLDANTVAGVYPGASAFKASTKTLKVASTTIKMRFVDENKWNPIQGLSVLVDGTTYTTDASGRVSAGIGALTSQTITIDAWQNSNYAHRYFEVDVNAYAVVDLNILMLHDYNGLDLNFRFYQANGTTLLPSTRLRVYKEDGNYVGIRSTNAQGYTSFFLSPDTNYYFVTPTGYRYETITVTLNLPKNEATLASISPYDAEVARLDKKLFTGKTTAQALQMFPNTVDYYQLDINAGLNYYSRKYEVSYRGNPITAAFQPYLVLVADGVSSIFYTKESLTLETEPNTLIKVYKTIVGAGTVEVQSVITDDAGTASMSFIIDDEYTFYFYNSAGTLLSTKTLRPNFTSYYVYVDTGGTTWTEPKVEYVTVTGFPNVGYVAFASIGYDINVAISVTNGTISKGWLSVRNDDGNISFNQACGSGCGYTVARKDMNATSWVTAEVYVVTASGLVYKTSWSFTPYDASGDNLLANLRGIKFRQEWGCSANPNEPCFFLMIVSAFLTIGAIAGAGAATHDASAMGIVTMIMLGIFTYLLWIPVSVFILACLGAFAFMIVSRGGF